LFEKLLLELRRARWPERGERDKRRIFPTKFWLEALQGGYRRENEKIREMRDEVEEWQKCKIGRIGLGIGPAESYFFSTEADTSSLGKTILFLTLHKRFLITYLLIAPFVE
jgi:hypothetical protein